MAGKKLGTPPGGASFKLLPLLAKKNGVDYAKIDVLNVAPNLQEQMLLQGQVDVIAIFTATSYMNLVALKLDPEKDFRWIYYADSGLDLYSNGVMVSQKLAKEKPEAVKGLVRAINKAMRDVLANPDAAIDLIVKKEALVNRAIEKQRLLYVTRTLIATPEAAELGIGDTKDARMADCDRHHRHVVRTAAQARGRGRVQPRVPAAEGRAHAGQGDQLTAAWAVAERYRKMRELTCAHLLAAADATVASAQTIRIDGERIAAVGPAAPAPRSSRCWRLPVLCNAHDHARDRCARARSAPPASRWRSGCTTWRWCRRSIPISRPRSSLARSALGGAGVVMVHYTRTQGLTDLPTEAAEVARAARDVGVRVGFAVAMRDRNPLVYGPSEPILDALPSEAREEIRRRFIRTPATARRTACAGGRSRGRRRQRDVRRAVRPAGRAVVHDRTAGSDRRSLGAHRPARPHAPARNALPARLGG